MQEHKTDTVMRCMNCGWENPENLTRCEKCNAPLEPIKRSEISDIQGAPNEALKGTISEQIIFHESKEPVEIQNNCPHCGYPLRDGCLVCPNCGKESNKKPEMSSHNAETGHNATVNPWANPITGKSFYLQPIAWEHEKDVPGILHYFGDEVELNRANTDDANNTITSKVQAKISHDNGVWIIEDKSSQGTTFVQATRRIELNDGDVIMLGNRKFIFKTE